MIFAMKTLTSLLTAVFLLAASAWSIDLPALVRQAKPAIVEILTFDRANQPIASGTGFFVSQDGVALTNYHVIADASKIVARTSNGTVYRLKKVCGYSESCDIAELQFITPEVPFLTLGPSANAVEGQHILVIGYPLGLDICVSDGIISGFRENHSLVQVTAPISPGSSGSPVLDESGKVVGIVRYFYLDGQNLNVAICSETVRSAIAKALEAPAPPPPIAKAVSTWTPTADEVEQTLKVISVYTEAIRLKPDNFSAYLWRGACYGA
jgi:S1-C subfamily serine protease